MLADRTQFALGQEAWDEFSETLERPAQSIPALAELFARASVFERARGSENVKFFHRRKREKTDAYDKGWADGRNEVIASNHKLAEQAYAQQRLRQIAEEQAEACVKEADREAGLAAELRGYLKAAEARIAELESELADSEINLRDQLDRARAAEAALASIEERLREQPDIYRERELKLLHRAEASEARIAEVKRPIEWLIAKNEEIQRWADTRLQDAEARIAELQTGYDALLRTAGELRERWEDSEAELTEWRTSIATEALQARVEALTAALREIDRLDRAGHHSEIAADMGYIARVAFASGKDKP